MARQVPNSIVSRLLATSLCACALGLVWPQVGRCQSGPASFGGTLAATTDYIYRGVSQSGDEGALQADLHGNTAGGTFAGVWATTRDRDLRPHTPGEVQLYLGQRLDLGADWSATLSGRADYFVGGSPRHSDDYQELSAALTWLDRYTFSVGYIPSAVRYTAYLAPEEPPEYYYHVSRSAAVVGDASGQWLLRSEFVGGSLYATAAAGYYYAGSSEEVDAPALGYLYGNAGLALERRRWRLDLGYFAAQSRAAQLFPYPVANRLACTLSWQF
jgi:uncharacterized protein (TIGR02001 family)